MLLLFENVSEGVVLVSPHGEVDMGNSGALRDGLKRAGQSHRVVVVDLAKCRYLDSCGVGVLLQANLEFGNRLRVVLAADHVMKRIFDVLGLRSIFTIEPTLEKALARAS